MATDKSKVEFLVSYDADDETMTDAVLREARKLVPAITLVKGNSKSKIAAVNADINEYSNPWDVILIVSDDMVCRRFGWDQMIRDEFKKNYPEMDGAIWFHDGTKQREICTLSCMGRKLYDSFGYIYHPSYYSFFCDNEFSEVCKRDGKITFTPKVIASHEHPAWGGNISVDALYKTNNKYWQQDKTNYETRKKLGFPK